MNKYQKKKCFTNYIMNCGKNNISQAFYDRQLKVETN